MTDEEINKAIALHLGWKGVVSDPITGVMGLPPAKNEVDHVCLRTAMWTKDLNAMHEAEKVILPKLGQVYANKLAFITLADYSDDPDFFCATARQRAEAFLKTLGKWEATTEESSVDGRNHNE